MADDLDDFFDEVEEAEKEAVKEEGDQDKIDEVSKQPIHPTENDNADAKQTKSEDDEPPKKRAKIGVVAASAPPVRPRGVVVAASSSVASNKPASTGPSSSAITAPPSSASNIGPAFHPATAPSSYNLPPLPPGPPPPPPPPMATANGVTVDPNHVHKHGKPVKRMAAGKVWVDASLAEWPENDFRIFVGNLSRDVTDTQLCEHFQQRYASTAMAKVVKDKEGMSKGYGFVSFLQPLDCAKAIREQDQKWLGSRPIRVKRSDWKERDFKTVVKQNKKEAKKQKRLGLL